MIWDGVILVSMVIRPTRHLIWMRWLARECSSPTSIRPILCVRHREQPFWRDDCPLGMASTQTTFTLAMHTLHRKSPAESAIGKYFCLNCFQRFVENKSVVFDKNLIVILTNSMVIATRSLANGIWVTKNSIYRLNTAFTSRLAQLIATSVPTTTKADPILHSSETTKWLADISRTLKSIWRSRFRIWLKCISKKLLILSRHSLSHFSSTGHQTHFTRQPSDQKNL